MIILVLPLWLYGQKQIVAEYPQQYFQSPMDEPLLLSATFGDLRSNHFHSGIDLRTNSEEGKHVYAAADGWVSRIKVSAFGYGKAIYIAHPNGYTTVYGHLREYSEAIEKYVYRRQNLRESFEVDLFPAGSELKVKKGQLIAFSGNTGGSSGPHLHFEIRDSRTEAIINPLLFGLNVKDELRPEISGVQLCKIDAAYRANSGTYSSFRLRPNSAERPITVSAGDYGLLLDAAEFLSEPGRKMGWNLARVEVNDVLHWAMNLERFQFHETRLINTHLDYFILKAKKEKWVKLWGDDGNTLPFFQWPLSRGVLKVKEGSNYKVKIVVSDLAGFKDSVIFYLIGTALEQPNSSADKTEQVYCTPEAGGRITTNRYEVRIPPDALFFPVALSVKADTSGANPVITLLPENIALNKSITIKIKPGTAARLRPSALLITQNTGSGFTSIGGGYDEGWVTATTKEWGTYTIDADTLDPEIKLVGTNPLTFEIKDHLSGIASYRTTLGGKWLLMEYDAKSNRLKVHAYAQPEAGKHAVELTVRDKKGRKTVYRKTMEF